MSQQLSCDLFCLILDRYVDVLISFARTIKLHYQYRCADGSWLKLAYIYGKPKQVATHRIDIRAELRHA